MTAQRVREFGGLLVDTTDWPIIVLEFPEQRFPDADCQAGLDCITQLMRECARERQKCTQITDLTRIQQIPNASQRKFAGEWVKQNSELVVAASVGGATVTPSAILRGLVTAVHWFHRPPTPNAFLASKPDAQRYVIKLLEDARVPLPARVSQLRDRLARETQAFREKQPSGWTLPR
jgi:hypothetical protein